MTATDDARRAWGDFQTPETLAAEACARLWQAGCRPAAIIEPTCGQGAFLRAGAAQFADARSILGVEINPAYLATARSSLQAPRGARLQLLEADVFGTDWPALLAPLPEPLLVLGNPPWVTTADQGRRDSDNTPARSSAGLRGLEAQTGKSNFDVAEWIVRLLLGALSGREATLAMLIKTSVARKVHAFAAEKGLPVAESWLARIDAQREFGAATSACWYVCRLSPGATPDYTLTEYASLSARTPERVTGIYGGRLVSDMRALERWRELHIDRADDSRRWRSGIKHDASAVLEFQPAESGRLVNGAGEEVELEPDVLAPLLKSSDLLHGRTRPVRRLLVTQRSLQDEPARLAVTAPLAWKYLQRNAAVLAARKSRIYRGRPEFVMFGVGPYSFAPAKVAISGFARELRFAVVGRSGGKAVVFDDVCTFLPCRTVREARRVAAALHARPAQEFLRSLIFWDAKRPVTVDVLQQLNLTALERMASRR
jgi:predicted RNA methylase